MRFRISERREELGITMKQLAEEVGVSEATISRWESGDVTNLRRDNIIGLARSLQVSPEYIMGWDDESEQMSPYFAIPGISEIAKAAYENVTLRYLLKYATEMQESDLIHLTEIANTLAKANKRDAK